MRSSVRLATGAVSMTLAGALLLGCSATSVDEGGAEPTEGAPEPTDEFTLADMDPITLSWAESVPEGVSEGVLAWMDYIEEKTDGKVTIEPYWSASLFPENEALTQVGAGVADIASMNASHAPDDIPITNQVYPLGTAADAAYPLGFIQSMGATAEFYWNNEEIHEEMDAHNVQLLSGHSSVRFSLMCREEVETLEDVKGLRTRVGGRAWLEEATALGMEPQFTPIVEAYEALQRGILDCLVWPESNFEMFSMWDVAKFYAPGSFSNSPGTLTMINKDVWETFPNDLKQIFADGAAYMVAAQTKSVATDVGSFVANAPSNGVEFGDISELNAVVSEVQQGVLGGFTEAAPDALQDPQGFKDEYLGYLEGWHSVLTESGLTTAADQTVANQAVATTENEDEWSKLLLEQLLERSAGRFAQ